MSGFDPASIPAVTVVQEVESTEVTLWVHLLVSYATARSAYTVVKLEEVEKFLADWRRDWQTVARERFNWPGYKEEQRVSTKRASVVPTLEELGL